MPDKKSPLHSKILIREIYEDPKSPECLDFAHNWLRDCLENHPRCIASAASCPQLPTRVIYVGNEQHDPRLVLSDHKLGRYVALSYCWGGKHAHNVMLTTKTLADFQKGIPLSSFPKTLQDAVYVVRALGIPYLWIDALCIIQDSTEDWVIESGRMNTIYNNATLGLFATNAESANDGFLGKREIYAEYSVSFTQLQSLRTPGDNRTNNENCDKIVLRFEHPHHVSDDFYGNSLWARRGWTLQERLSPLRGLSYTRLQMSWACLTCNVGENGMGWDNELRRKKDMKQYIGGDWGSSVLTHLASRWNTVTRLQDINLAHLPTSDLWYYIMRNYQKRSLSKESDRLPAVAGIAKVLESRETETGRYFAGLWEGDFRNGMCWEVVANDSDSKHDQSFHSNDEAHAIVVPSWSWASTVHSSYERLQEILQKLILTERPAKGLMTIHAPHAINDEDRFIPRSPLVLRITAPCRLLSPSWYSEQASTGNQDPYQIALESLLRQELGMQEQSGTWDDEEGYRQGRVLEFARKHQPWEGQHLMAVQALEARSRKPETGDESDIEYGFILVLESVKDKVGRYRRVAALGLDTWRDAVFESNGLNYSGEDLLNMIWEKPWPQMEFELV